MNILNTFIAYILTLVVFLIIDLTWLGFIAKDLYKKYLGHYLTDNVNWTAAIIFYILFVIGISIFAIYPAINKNSALSAIILGALFGFFTYATYDLTNLATLKEWPVTIVVIDIIWGTFLAASVSVAGFYIIKFIKQ